MIDEANARDLMELLVSESYDPLAEDTREWVDGAPLYPDGFNVLLFATGRWDWE